MTLHLTLLLLVLNVFDAHMTAYIVNAGIAKEANPVLAPIVALWGVEAAMIGKLLWISVWTTVLYRNKSNKALTLACIVYTLLALWHLTQGFYGYFS